MAFLILGKASQLRGGDAGRKWGCAREFNSGEGMLAGGGSVVGGRTPAKPRWSVVMIFWEFSSGRGSLNRKKVLLR